VILPPRNSLIISSFSPTPPFSSSLVEIKRPLTFCFFFPPLHPLLLNNGTLPRPLIVERNAFIPCPVSPCPPPPPPLIPACHSPLSASRPNVVSITDPDLIHNPSGSPFSPVSPRLSPDTSSGSSLPLLLISSLFRGHRCLRPPSR